MAKQVRCQRIGCDAFFSPDHNPDDACTFHPGPPLFHDGGKEWSCCKQRSHDFNLFLSIQGCTTGKHSSEKPQTIAAPSPNKPIPLSSSGSTADSAKASCSRCRQGFFCSDHGTKVASVPAGSSTVKSISKPEKLEAEVEASPAPLKVVDLDAKQICKNKGCGKTFTERENHEFACTYHPGPAVFHDRSRGWQCCDVHTKEFEEFLEIPPCTKGWHNGGND